MIWNNDISTTILLTTKDEKQAEELLAKIKELVNAAENASIESFSNPLSAFSSMEGPFRVKQLIEDDDMEELNDKALMKEIGKDTASDIEDNLVYDDSEYACALDGSCLRDITISNALRLFQERLETMDEHDKAIAEQFIEDFKSDDED